LILEKKKERGKYYRIKKLVGGNEGGNVGYEKQQEAAG